MHPLGSRMTIMQIIGRTCPTLLPRAICSTATVQEPNDWGLLTALYLHAKAVSPMACP
jgi:hypothetical protein